MHNLALALFPTEILPTKDLTVNHLLIFHFRAAKQANVDIAVREIGPECARLRAKHLHLHLLTYNTKNSGEIEMRMTCPQSNKYELLTKEVI